MDAVEVDVNRCYVAYKDWLEVYEICKNYSLFSEGIAFCTNNPGTVNNRKKDVRGCTLLFQAAFWGVDRGVLQAFKNLGADPTLRDYAGKTALEHARMNGKTSTADSFIDVFGRDFEDKKVAVLGAAKIGNLPQVFQLLGEDPHLIHVQSYGGWGILHHLALHGMRPSIFRRLLSMGACSALLTHEGETYLQVLERAVYGGSPERRAAVEEALTSFQGASLQQGSRVRVLLKEGPITGTVAEIIAQSIVVRASTEGYGAKEETYPAWRVIVLPDELQHISDADLGIGLCEACNDPVFGCWVLGSACTGNRHLMCGDCTINWAWAQFTSGNFPLKCAFCNVPCNLNEIPAGTGRSMNAAWSRVAPNLNTQLTYNEFFEVLKTKNTEDRCFRCAASPYHTGKTCEEHVAHEAKKKTAADTLAEQQFRDWMRQVGAKECPTCHMVVTKENLEAQATQAAECHKMICRNCNTRFCFNCRAVHTPTFRCGCTPANHGFIDPLTGKFTMH